MYEDTTQPVSRRILLIILSAVLIIAVAWIAIWLVFFHHPSTKPAHKSTPSISHSTPATTPQSSPNASTSTAPSAGNNSAPSSQNSPSPTGGTSTSPTAPSQLANTGAGNVFIPFVVATLGGMLFYQIRLHRKTV